jgi:L-asparaginase
VSSNYVLEDERANGLANFATAVSFISRKIGHGVFIAYQNTMDCPRIHRASRVLSQMPYSDDIVSLKGQYYGSFAGDILKEHVYEANPNYKECQDETEPFVIDEMKQWNSGILEIYPATGFTYPLLSCQPIRKELPATASVAVCSDRVKAILHHTYHSGTICANTNGLEQFAKQADEQGIPIYLTGAERGKHYESTQKFEALGIKVLPEASPIAMYCKLFLCMAAGKDADKVMNSSLGGDLFYATVHA